MTTEINTVNLTETGAGTVMGEFLRQYWIPCILSSELVSDQAPIRLPLMGEKLIAFRDTSGKVGILDQRCPHRCASLFLGRNEENGLRCVYHGWKFDADGNCVDLPSVSEPESSLMTKKVKARAYRTAERNGLIWVYMGKNQDSPPPLPNIEPNLMPESDVQFQMIARNCNWLQSLEGDIDTAHFGFLHTGSLDVEKIEKTHPFYPATVERRSKYEVIETPWGTSYGAYRPAEDGSTYWRTANYLFPFWSQVPQGEFSRFVHARAWVPIDDHRTMFISMTWKQGTVGPEVTDPEVLGEGYEIRDNFMPNSTDWYGRWNLVENEANDWLIDRQAQASGTNFTGINNIHLQDQAVTESMGPITDHDWEHLTTADLMIARTRRCIAREALAYAETHEPSPGVHEPDIFLRSRSGYFFADPEIKWQDAYAENVAKAIRPARDAIKTSAW